MARWQRHDAMHAEPDALPPRRRTDWSAILALHLSLSVLVGLVLTLLWGLTGQGSPWPLWVWFGLAVAAGAHAAVRAAVVHTRGQPARLRGFALHAALSGAAAAMFAVLWLLTGAGAFWPAWPLLVLATAVAVHAVLAGFWPRIVHGDPRALAVRVDELTRTRRGALDVQAAELRRIERDLHDGAQARLVALSLQLGRAEERLADRPEDAALVRAAREEAGAAIAELRDLARGIAPPVLSDRGLEAACESLARRAAAPVTVDASLGRRLAPVVETAAYFVVAESLTNVAKHAPGAPARVGLHERDGTLVVTVADDGSGGADPAGSGLTGLRRRVEALDGRLEVTSAPGRGTTIRAELPCGS